MREWWTLFVIVAGFSLVCHRESYDNLALALQQLEDDEAQNLENKEQMIMRDGKFPTMMQQQEEDEVLKLM